MPSGQAGKALLKKLIPYLFIAGYFLLHVPFLTCDPDSLADPGVRHAWTDEGLYSSQIRNYIHHGSFGIEENSVFVMGPLFSLLQYPFFRIFGTHLIVGRLIVLLFTCLVLFIFLKDKQLRYTGLFLGVCSFLEFHVFQFAHYSLTELVCIDFILLGLFFTYRSQNSGEPKKATLMLLAASFFIFCSYCTKMQFIYTALIIPATTFILALRNKNNNKPFRSFFRATGFAALFLALWLVWVYSHWDFFVSIFSILAEERLAGTLPDVLARTLFNAGKIFMRGQFDGILLLLFISIIAFLVLTLRKKTLSLRPEILIFATVWLLAELPKVTMRYLPNQYLISTIVASGLFSAVTFSGIIQAFKSWRPLIFGLTLMVLVLNLINYSRAWNRRSYQLQAINKYLSSCNVSDKVILGSWAASVSWDCQAYTLPVSYRVLNWYDPVRTYRPAAIITEVDEKDSDFNYKNQGIDLVQASDSVRTFRVYDYNLLVCWIRQDPHPHGP